MERMTKAKLCDATLLKFLGNKSFNWNEIHLPEFYSDLDDNYFVVENILNFLIGDGQLQKNFSNGVEYIRLSEKGWGTMTDLENEGYVARDLKLKKEEERNEKVTETTLENAQISKSNIELAEKSLEIAKQSLDNNKKYLKWFVISIFISTLMSMLGLYCTRSPTDKNNDCKCYYYKGK